MWFQRPFTYYFPNNLRWITVIIAQVPLDYSLEGTYGPWMILRRVVYTRLFCGTVKILAGHILVINIDSTCYPSCPGYWNLWRLAYGRGTGTLRDRTHTHMCGRVWRTSPRRPRDVHVCWTSRRCRVKWIFLDGVWLALERYIAGVAAPEWN